MRVLQAVLRLAVGLLTLMVVQVLVPGVGPRAGVRWPVVRAAGWLACWSLRCLSTPGPVSVGWLLADPG